MVFGGCLSSRSRTLRLLSGQEIHNVQLTPRLSDDKAGRPTLLAFRGSQDSPENELELSLRVDGENPSMNHSSSFSGSMANGSLPRERLMHQALEDLPQGVDPARREVGTRPNCTGGPHGILPHSALSRLEKFRMDDTSGWDRNLGSRNSHYTPNLPPYPSPPTPTLPPNPSSPTPTLPPPVLSLRLRFPRHLREVQRGVLQHGQVEAAAREKEAGLLLTWGTLPLTL